MTRLQPGTNTTMRRSRILYIIQSYTGTKDYEAQQTRIGYTDVQLSRKNVTILVEVLIAHVVCYSMGNQHGNDTDNLQAIIVGGMLTNHQTEAAEPVHHKKDMPKPL